jgi:hypothetical protein
VSSTDADVSRRSDRSIDVRLNRLAHGDLVRRAMVAVSKTIGANIL